LRNLICGYYGFEPKCTRFFSANQQTKIKINPETFMKIFGEHG
jgi:hypothetical protein